MFNGRNPISPMTLDEAFSSFLAERNKYGRRLVELEYEGKTVRPANSDPNKWNRIELRKNGKLLANIFENFLKGKSVSESTISTVLGIEIKDEIERDFCLRSRPDDEIFDDYRVGHYFLHSNKTMHITKEKYLYNPFECYRYRLPCVHATPAKFLEWIKSANDEELMLMQRIVSEYKVEEKTRLGEICNETVYQNNIFHILNLRVTATSRQIRRRREDLDAARNLGKDAWKNEFKHLLGGREIPTYEEILEAFSNLEDPEYRLISEFFWLWPMEDDDRALEEIESGRMGRAIDIWEQNKNGFNDYNHIAMHNLAVIFHLCAISHELLILGSKSVSQDFRNEMLSCWNKSFVIWEELADSYSFWKILENFIRGKNDPRLTGSYFCQFRDDFPIAFDNINAQLAARYARVARFQDAKRHVDYMTRTMRGLDDVQENLNTIIGPLERNVERVISSFTGIVQANPLVGLEYAEKLLSVTEEIRNVVEGLLGRNQKKRNQIFITIISACNSYTVLYGNKTEDWESCLNFLVGLKKIDCSIDSLKIIDGSIRTVSKNLKYEKEYHYCWLCKKNCADTKYGIQMYGDVVREWGQVKYRHGTIDVPICSQCNNEHTAFEKRQAWIGIIAYLVSYVIMYFINSECFLLWIPAAFFPTFFVLVISKWIAPPAVPDFLERCRSFPAVEELVKKGWDFGDKPS